MRTLGIDLGSRRVGLALSDEGGRFATPYDVLAVSSAEAAIAPIIELIRKEGIQRLVLGLPINMDGSEGPRAQSTRAFARNLARLTELPIALWDERLSTAAVERELIGMDMSRARRAEVIDEHAAIFILQGALDRLAKAREKR